MSLNRKSHDLGRVSIYDLNTDDIQLKTHTGYDEEHLKRLKYLFQQITNPEKNTLDINHFESAARRTNCWIISSVKRIKWEIIKRSIN